MKTIKGKVCQIISPEKIGNFMISMSSTAEKVLKDKYLIVIEKDISGFYTNEG